MATYFVRNRVLGTMGLFDFNENNSSSRRALVTGSSGNIGTTLVSKLLAEGWEVFGVTSRPNVSNNPSYHQISFDWHAPKKFLVPPIDVIFYLASQNSAYEARDNVIVNVTNNLLSFVTIIESVKESGSRPALIQTGSVSEYGLEIPVSHDESSLNPLTFYECSKLTMQIYGDQFVRENIVSHNFVLRLANVYGNNQRIDGAQRGFLDRCIRLGLSGESLTYFGTGDYVRDYIHIQDVVHALLICYEFRDKLEYRAYDIGTNVATSVFEMLHIVIREIYNSAKIIVNLYQKEFPTNSYEIEKRNGFVRQTIFGDETGWKSKITLPDGIRESVQSILKGK
jgi:UDP-glucose 4-epimerase